MFSSHFAYRADGGGDEHYFKILSISYLYLYNVFFFSMLCTAQVEEAMRIIHKIYSYYIFIIFFFLDSVYRTDGGGDVHQI